MFIELTDHLRCPADHEESFLVLLPVRMDGRRVVEGTLGCPRCGREVVIVGGVADFGGGEDSPAGTALDAAAVATFVGLEGPGGYLGLFGSAAAAADRLADLLPGIRLVLVNPPAGTAENEMTSMVRAGRSPLKSRSMRAAVMAGSAAADPVWVDRAADAVLPGNRLVVAGPMLARPDLEVLMEGAGLWVARKAPNRPVGA